MHYAVRKPCEDIKDRMLVCRENIGKIGSIKNVFQSWQHANPNVRAILIRNKAVMEKIVS